MHTIYYLVAAVVLGIENIKKKIRRWFGSG